MNSAIIFIKNEEEKQLALKDFLGKSLIERTADELKKLDLEKILLVGSDEHIDGVENALNIVEAIQKIQGEGKTLLTSPLYPFVAKDDMLALLEVEDGGAVISDGEDIYEIFMIPNNQLNKLDSISYKPVTRDKEKLKRYSEGKKEEKVVETKPDDVLGNDCIIFGLSANKDLVTEICEYLKVEPGKIDVFHFADGETLIDIGESVRGKKVFVIQSTCKPVNDNLMELLICIDALRRSAASEINCIVPYYGYARQDRKAKPRQPITARLCATLFEAAGATRLEMFDLHAAQIQGFFSIPVDDFTAVPMMAQYFLRKDIDPSEFVVVSPDHGGVKRARNLSEIIGTPIAIIDKRRARPNECEAANVVGDVNGKNVIIIDDICDTGGSLAAACELLKEKGAKDIYVSVTHGVFSGSAIDKIENSSIKELVVTNTIPLSAEQKAKTTKITVLSIGWMVSKLILAIANRHPVSDVYNLFQVSPTEILH